MMDGRVLSIFEDAQLLFEEALRELEAGNLRNASEKARGATMRATAALVLARTGREPERSDLTSRALRELGRSDPRTGDTLEGRCYSRMAILHGDCFYLGMCEPQDDIARRIRETEDYIRDARQLAG